MNRINLNRMFRLGIRSKLVIAFMALSTVPLLFSGLYAIHVYTAALQESELMHLEHDVFTVRERTSTFLSGVESDIRFLQNSHAFHRFFRHPDEENATAPFVQEVIDLAQSKGIYYQIRYLDGDGQEKINVRQMQEGYAAMPADPDAAGGYYYVHLIKDLHREELASSPVELSDGRGNLVAAITYALPIFVEGSQPSGILVVNLFAKNLFAVLEKTHNNPHVQTVVVSNEGYYLYNSGEERDWSRLLVYRDEHNLYRDYPPAVARQIMSGKPGMLISNGDVIAYVPFWGAVAQKMGVYTLFIATPRKLILASVFQYERAFYGLLALCVVCSIALAYLAAAHFTRPINALQTEASVIAGGEFGRRLWVETYDEIQQLAETFNEMAEAIQERERQIRRHGEALEGIVADRTRELAEEKGKLQAILDSVPSAFVVLDRKLHILSASSAFEGISGHAPEAVVGQPCGKFFPDCSRSGECPAAIALRTGSISSEVKGLSLPGEEQSRYIERIAIPVARNGAVERVIEVVTDVTARKEMENRVIHSEKLATTGEMAAVIAHEMRNSLTSVKMILQLELEREDLSGSDREALGVASDSVRRMETVVTHLLKFARPAPPQFQLQSINAILREPISLIQHQTRRKGIVLEEAFAPDLPPVQGDADQLKEVFVNLLLNAAQASPEMGSVAVTTRFDRATRHVEVCVDDTGSGIPEGQQERIFDPFFTTKADGTGLGLSMARRTVEAHGGEISAINRPGGGARFAVRLPAGAGSETRN